MISCSPILVESKEPMLGLLLPLAAWWAYQGALRSEPSLEAQVSWWWQYRWAWEFQFALKVEVKEAIMTCCQDVREVWWLQMGSDIPNTTADGKTGQDPWWLVGLVRPVGYLQWCGCFNSWTWPIQCCHPSDWGRWGGGLLAWNGALGASVSWVLLHRGEIFWKCSKEETGLRLALLGWTVHLPPDFVPLSVLYDHLLDWGWTPTCCPPLWF